MRRYPSKSQIIMVHAAFAATVTLLLSLFLWWFFRSPQNPWIVAGIVLLSVNVTTFGYYGWDKRRARRGIQRIPELVLHGLTAAGGGPAALTAMRVFRHKTAKGRFLVVFVALLVVQLLVIGWIGKVIWLD